MKEQLNHAKNKTDDRKQIPPRYRTISKTTGACYI